MGYATPLEARIARKVTKAIHDFSLLADGDRVMNGFQVIERRRGTEITAIDEGHRESPLRRVVAGRQPVNAAANDQHVELGGRKPP